MAVIPLIIGAGGLVGLPPAMAAAPGAGRALAVAPSANQAAAGTELYVSKDRCRSGATGSEQAPFCTVSAAAALVQPGWTVLVAPGNYQETVTITRSGTQEAPITFRALAVAGTARVGWGMDAGSTFNLLGVHDVVIADFALDSLSSAPVVTVDKSERITLDGNGIYSSSASLGLRITNESRDVTVTRQYFRLSAGAAMAVEAGSLNTVVAGNQGYARSGLTVTDAPNTVVTGNTWVSRCRLGIDVTGTSSGASIRNNIVATNDVLNLGACKVPAEAPAIAVDGSSTMRTVVDHNLLDPSSGGPLYVWGGTAYTARDAFAAATGQGVHDLVGDPRFDLAGINKLRGWLALLPDSPAIDSADGSAPGAIATDILRNPYTDDPAVSNSGTGSGYRDRGGWERQGPVENGQPQIRRVVGGGSTDTLATGATTRVWPTESNQGAYGFRFSDQTNAIITQLPQTEHRFRRAGMSCAHYYLSPNGFRDVSLGIGYGAETCTVVGTQYTAVTPKRVLDTRAAIGVTSRSALASFSEVPLSIPEIDGVPAADISAVVLNVTVTEPTANGFLKVYEDFYQVPETSSVNFVARETVPNLVTAPMRDGLLWFRNESGGSVHVIADVQGYYSADGSGFRPLSPTRVLDTRTGTARPMAPNGDLRLDLSGRLPADATAVILNVTVTQPTTAGVLTLYPDGTAVPVASNLNFVTGQTIPNLVTVPVVGGKVALRNASSGTTHVIADLAGYFGSAASGATQSYVPYATRIADSRSGTGLIGRTAGPIEKQGVANVRAPYYTTQSIYSCMPSCPTPTAMVANLTVTAPTTAGVLTAYPYLEARPAASNVNFVAGETASNLAVVKTGEATVSLYNNSSGSTQVIVDQAGYFIGAAS
ncbi:right-handed parallel beta-helix repeat-containing protein [Micromonospora zamorensis]|uniref:right-handed parallel beta-helix repeat-containing protein n=1 Tax=Micromonospora zamorensis TaxID=709883 RepID=UPI0033F3CE45